jgi:2-oxoisovalerate dehydrogenase E1 component
MHLLTRIQCFFEHKQLYQCIQECQRLLYFTIRKAALIKEGNEVTIIAFGAAVHWALDTLSNNPEISADLLDLRTLQPLDTEAIFASVKKNRKGLFIRKTVCLAV